MQNTIIVVTSEAACKTLGNLNLHLNKISICPIFNTDANKICYCTTMSAWLNNY